MSKWTHAMCDSCYDYFEPGRTPMRLLNMPGGTEYYADTCCRCGNPTQGVYYRLAPETLPCGGTVGEVHQDEVYE